ncbi:MAG TPA: hypothetical protein VJA46_09605 [Acidimicrobiia bacterium]|jgi:hypothetical protein|nr:hypothetical protein [Acidimicrobiia bacterium]
MSTNLVNRIQDIPGVAAVSLDLEDPEAGGINVRLEPDADEMEVLERVRGLLVAYGVRSQGYPTLRVGRTRMTGDRRLGVDVRITPIKGGARVEVVGNTVRSFRVVPPEPTVIAQGLADAWCQVLGRAPVEISRVSVTDDKTLEVVALDAPIERTGEAELTDGWTQALALAVGEAIGVISKAEEVIDTNVPSTAW